MSESLQRAQWRSQMVMIRHLVDNADAETANFYYEQLMEQCKLLARRFRVGNQFLQNVRDKSVNVVIDSAPKSSQMAT